MIAAIMAALPVIQQIEQGLATRVANGVSAFFAPTDSGSPGQNVPSQAASSSANSAQSPSASSLSNSVTSALLQLQNASGLGQVHGHHHHGAGKYKAASDALSQLTDTSGSASSASSATSAVTA